ncbi:cleft lip and palate transmembrane protein 1 homolog [Aethina tumida]|uniref:cleft lip and palate transmembrane protein 1 homolog n=1 Tax=Aethina tumida TaxID=116153 RepID=UPI002148B73E|nr:cleft lip and palate transmembrane protein 1 homolog [Aethina tumida]
MSETATKNGTNKDNAVTPAGDQNPGGNQANGNPPPRQPTGLESFFAIAKSLILRALIVYFITSFFRKPPAQPVNDSGVAIPSKTALNLFKEGTPLALHVYLSESEILEDLSYNNLFWFKNGLTYGDWNSGPYMDGSYSIEKPVPISDNIRNNGSLYIHAFITRDGESPNPKAPNYSKDSFSSVFKQLNKYKKLKKSVTKNLLTGETENEELNDGKIISHWHPNFTINLVTDQTAWTVGSVPAPLDQFIKFTSDGQFYKPVLFGNDFWNMARDYKPLNDSLTLRITFQPLSLLKWQMYAAQNMRQMWNFFGDQENQSDEDQDTLKETLLDTNPYLLGVTIFVSLLHSIFEILAFKNDIQFWNNRNSLEGLSVKSVFFGVFQSLIVLLYVLDNETNTLVRISCFLGLGIELWKINKVVDVKLDGWKLQFTDKGSYVESSTKQYDELAFKYLSWLCFPLLAGYSVYALIYLEHKGWYSFVLDLLYGYLLTFGFIMMTPQLFINYKLKSVAHLPWRMLTYKFLNTFIDDMFAFVIKMPTMYRIGCFRDDIIFLIFLYQKWIYPVDKTRRNEFGFSGEEVSKTIQDKSIENKKED